jgi:hypothetical protein
MKTIISVLTVALFVAFFSIIFSDMVFAHEEMGKFKEEVRYITHIKPLFEQKCSACHGADSPEHGEFTKKADWYIALKKGPRMDTYGYMISYIGWPDAGSIMRRLDDSKNTKDGKQGNMYQYLGDTEDARQKNLGIFKQWIVYWTLKRWSDISKNEIDKFKIKY